jgi:hypothetical protein
VVEESKTAQVSSASTADVILEVLPVPPFTTVRMFGQGVQIGKFKTRHSIRKVLGALDETLYRLGLFLDQGRFISGVLQHPQSWVCKVTVDGKAGQHRSQNEFVIDLSWGQGMTTAAILICVFLFPIGLILVLIFYQMAQTETKRIIDDAFRSLHNHLAEDMRG